MANKVIYAEVEARNCTADLFVNGFPMPGVRQRTLFERFAISAQHWIIPEKNELSLFVDTEGTPSQIFNFREEKPRPEAEAIARFVEYPEGAIASPAEGRILAEVRYRGADDEGNEAPRVRTISADLPVQFGRWLWQDAPLLTLDEGTRSEAEGVLLEVQDALFGGSLQRMLDLIKIRWEEADRAYPGRDDQVDRGNLGGWLAQLASQPHRRVPLRPSEHDFRLVAGGRVVECIDKDFMASLRIFHEIEPNRFIEGPYPVFLARIGTALKVVR